MAYDEDLANRIRDLLADEDAITEKKMFGGLAFLLHGNMAVSASRDGGYWSASTLPTPTHLSRLPTWRGWRWVGARWTGGSPLRRWG